MPKWNPQPLKFIASFHIKLFYLSWFLVVWWPFERSSCRKKSSKSTHSHMKYSNNVQNISFLEAGSTSRGNISPEIPAAWRTVHGECKFNFLQNCSLFFFPNSSQGTTTNWNFSYFFQVGTRRESEHEFWRIWIITCLSTTSCPWCFDCASSCSQNMKFKLFSIFPLIPTTNRWKSLFSTPLCVL